MIPQTVYDKHWDSHLAHVDLDATTPLCSDSRLVHEATRSPQREGLMSTVAVAVPGWTRVQVQAHCGSQVRILRGNGAEWREPGYSMCLGRNAVQGFGKVLKPGGDALERAGSKKR